MTCNYWLDKPVPDIVFPPMILRNTDVPFNIPTPVFPDFPTSLNIELPDVPLEFPKIVFNLWSPIQDIKEEVKTPNGWEDFM